MKGFSDVSPGANDVILGHETSRLNGTVGEARDAMVGIDTEFSAIITRDPAMRAGMMLAAAVARSSLPVLITGETGTGKDLFAHAIHLAAGHPGQFVVENVAGLDDELLSDALFGHKRGAFTGALDERKGLVAAANRGTLFLDEIGDLTPRSQVKLLRLIENGRYYPVGSDVPLQADVRFVLATNRNLLSLVRDGSFREDLYYRIAVHAIELPPLRDRPTDIPLLVDYFVREAAAELRRPAPVVPQQTLDLLANELFPGNVRELRARVINAVTLCPGSILLPDWFSRPADILRTIHHEQQVAFGEVCNDEVRFPATLPTISELGTMLMDEALRRCKGNQSAAAALLGVTPSAVNKRLKRNTCQTVKM